MSSGATLPTPTRSSFGRAAARKPSSSTQSALSSRTAGALVRQAAVDSRGVAQPLAQGDDARAVALGHGPRGVGAGVVDDDDLGARLRRRSGQRVLQQRRLVDAENDRIVVVLMAAARGRRRPSSPRCAPSCSSRRRAPAPRGEVRAARERRLDRRAIVVRVARVEVLGGACRGLHQRGDRRWRRPDRRVPSPPPPPVRTPRRGSGARAGRRRASARRARRRAGSRRPRRLSGSRSRCRAPRRRGGAGAEPLPRLDQPGEVLLRPQVADGEQVRHPAGGRRSPISSDGALGTTRTLPGSTP